MTLDLLHDIANTEVFCLFHNCMWQSRHSEINGYFLALCQKPMDCPLFTGLPVLIWSASTFSSASLSLSTNVQQTVAHNSSQVSPCLRWCFRSQTRHLIRFPEQANRMVAHSSQVSPCLHLGFWFLVGFVVSLHFLQQLLNPILSSNFSVSEIFGGGRGDAYTSRTWFLQFPSWYPSGYNELGVCRKGWLRSIVFDRTWIISLEQFLCRPNTPCFDVSSTFSDGTMQDAVLPGQFRLDLCVLCS